jgi:hypothetical protein
VPAALLTLALVALAGVLLRRSTRTVESAGAVLSGLEPDEWTRHAAELQRAGDEVRDAVDHRQPR